MADSSEVLSAEPSEPPVQDSKPEETAVDSDGATGEYVKEESAEEPSKVAGDEQLPEEEGKPADSTETTEETTKEESTKEESTKVEDSEKPANNEEPSTEEPIISEEPKDTEAEQTDAPEQTEETSHQNEQDLATTDKPQDTTETTEKSTDEEPGEQPAGDEAATEIPKEDSISTDQSTDQVTESSSEEQATTEVFSESAIDLQGQISAIPLEDIIEEEEAIDREALMEEIVEALGEQERLAGVRAALEHKIAEYLISRKKGDERSDPSRSMTDHEKRYSQCMAGLDRLKAEIHGMQESFQLQEQELRIQREAKLAEVSQANAEFAEFKKEIALTAVHSRSGKKITAPELDNYQSTEDAKELEVIAVRLENIKLQNKIAKLEAQIKQKEQLAEGLHMIDFEQLKINNVDLNEKIEERNEDILKLRRKVTSTVQVLTHVKEKLQFLQAESVDKRSQLSSIDGVVAKRRDHLTRMKQARDSLRMDNNRLKQRGGLVGHKDLLLDYEQRKDQNEDLAARLDSLQQHHSELSVQCDGLRRKIEHAKTIHV